MIKALILDIDGIILGHADGLNFPLPTAELQERLQNLAKRIPISLCTVKAYFAVKPIIEACGLQEFDHITDAGATIINGTTGKTVTAPIDLDCAKEIIEALRREEIYTEWYTDNNFYSLPHENSMIKEGRRKLFGRESTIINEATTESICKIIALPLNEWQQTSIIAISKRFTSQASLHWGINPSLLPRMAAFFTNPLATKRTGATKIAELSKIPLSETLALGDSANDWTFMSLCGFVGTIGNGAPELKELVKGKGKNGFVTEKTVDENGLLDVLDHFGV